MGESLTAFDLALDLPPVLQGMRTKLSLLRAQGHLLLQAGDCGLAQAPSNIALLKYWGKIPQRAQLPVNSSISFRLGGFRSSTAVTVRGRFFPESEPERISGGVPYENRIAFNETAVISAPTSAHQYESMPPKMDRFVRALLSGWATDIALDVLTHNNFPTACGIASSASGYAALVGAVADLARLDAHFTPDECQAWMTEWARLGSGSATRSVAQHLKDVFVAWTSPLDAQAGFSSTLALECADGFKDLQHCVIVLDDRAKEVSSSQGHLQAHTSPLQTLRVAGMERKYHEMRAALAGGDFEKLRTLTEEDAFAMHAVMQTGRTPVCYFTPATTQAIAHFISLRDACQAQALWTLDAGPNLHLIWLPPARGFVAHALASIAATLGRTVSVLFNASSEGLHLGPIVQKAVGPNGHGLGIELISVSASFEEFQMPIKGLFHE